MPPTPSPPRPPALDPKALAPLLGLLPPGYPKPWHTIATGRRKWRLSAPLGLTDFGVNLVELPPGQSSSLRHWHSHEDEFIYIVAGTAVLVTDDGAQELGPGMAAGFPKGRADGHHLQNRGTAPVVYLEIGSRHPEDVATYADVDLKVSARTGFTRRDGTPVPVDPAENTSG